MANVALHKLSINAAIVLSALTSGAAVRELAIQPGEQWWGVCNDFGRQMPFTEASDFKCDLRIQNYSHQSLSFLASDKGRVLWCPEPVGVTIKGGKIRLESSRGEITLKEDAGKNLAEAYRYGSKTWFPPTGEDPELLYFSAPQYNTWIELTYHQNEKDILAYAQSMLDHGLPPGVFMIDDTWQHGYGTWEFDARRFSDPKGMMDKLHKMGYKVLLWMCPFVGTDTPEYRRIQFAKNPDDVKGWPTIGGFLLSSRKPGWGGQPPAANITWWNGVSALLDFTHPNAVAWFTEQLDRLQRDYGADGFKFDGGGVQFYAGTAGVEGGAPTVFANDPDASPCKQSALYGEFALKYKGSEYRNGFGFAGKPVIMRLHDKDHSFAALQRLIPDMLAAGFVGCPFICPDMVGGGSWSAFLPGAPFSQELFVRSAQVQALCPMMQLSASPWRYLDERHQAIFKAAVDLRQKYAPKFVELAKKAAKDGEPIMRNLEYSYPGMGYGAIKDEFLMGEDLLVAPVVEEGATSRKVVIPPGKWTADDGKVYEGPCTVEVAAPIERLPHFIRGEAAPADANKVSVTIETSLGDIVLELDREKAPITVANFLKYIEAGHYEGTVFHRVIDNFMIQGGGFTADMNQKPTMEPIRNEAANGLRNDRGTIAMARTMIVDSATSQFFVNLRDNDFLNYTAPNPRQFGYAVFGKVVKGMEVVDRIAKVRTSDCGMHQNVPVEPVMIKRVMVNP